MSYREEIVAVANAPAPKRRNRWRWVWRAALGLFLATASAIIGYIIDWKRTRHDGDAKLAAITTRLDADEPGWRFEAILADHNSKVPPPETNSALKAVAIVDRFPKSADPERSPAALLSKINDGRYPNELPNAEILSWIFFCFSASVVSVATPSRTLAVTSSMRTTNITTIDGLVNSSCILYAQNPSRR